MGQDVIIYHSDHEISSHFTLGKGGTSYFSIVLAVYLASGQEVRVLFDYVIAFSMLFYQQ